MDGVDEVVAMLVNHSQRWEGGGMVGGIVTWDLDRKDDKAGRVFNCQAIPTACHEFELSIRSLEPEPLFLPENKRPRMVLMFNHYSISLRSIVP